MNAKDTFIFTNDANPPISNQTTNIEMVTKLTDPNKLLLQPQDPIQNPKEIYVTIVPKNKNNNEEFFTQVYFLINRIQILFYQHLQNFLIIIII